MSKVVAKFHLTLDDSDGVAADVDAGYEHLVYMLCNVIDYHPTLANAMLDALARVAAKKNQESEKTKLN